jgi:D-alanyl-lipoteichoic acid acyltransferase DltB (MBOAT superfamily)
MLFSTVVTFIGGLLIQRLDDKKNLLEPYTDTYKLLEQKIILKKKIYLTLCLVINLGILFFFKYFNFLNTSITELFANFHVNWGFDNLNILLPVGISFYTFQALSYTFDVYYKKTNATTHFGKFALYVSFFPQLVAGPIERSWNLLPQFSEKMYFDYSRVKDGLLIILKGVLKKVVIADRLAIVVNTVYNSPENYFGLEVIIATIFFAFQIYCDFSAYTDIARGSARVMGFNIMENFKHPYFATSIPEFWRRWHISLTTWFRDYLYIPLGGNRVPVYRWYINIMLVFLISGLWHGAAWNFVIWGLIHGIFQLADIYSKKTRQFIGIKINLKKDSEDIYAFKVIWTFLLTCFAWLFFRAASLSDAIILLKNATVYNPWKLFDGSLYRLGLDAHDFIFAIISIILLLIVWILQRKRSLRDVLLQQHIITRWCVYILLILFIIIFGYYGSQYETSQFIYFQF